MLMFDTPMALVRSLDRSFFGCYSVLDSMHTKSGAAPSEEDICRLLANRYGLELSAAAHYAPCLAACYAWQKNKRIYIFERELAQALFDQAETLSEQDVLPLEALNRLPCNSFYIALSGDKNNEKQNISGCLVYLDASSGDEYPRLRFLFLMNGLKGFTAGAITLKPESSLIDCLPDAESLAYANLVAAGRGDSAALALALDKIKIYSPVRSVFHNLILRAVELVLYLASDNAEVSQEIPREKPEGENDLRGNSPADTQVDSFKVGLSISQRLRSAARNGGEGGIGTGKSVRTHVRRGHWHRYWKGPKSGDRKIVVHWVEPMIVGGSNAASTVSVTKISE